MCRVNSMDPSQLLHAHSFRSGEDLLFDLDEERHGHGTLSSMAAEPTTPSAGQVKSNLLIRAALSVQPQCLDPNSCRNADWCKCQ